MSAVPTIDELRRAYDVYIQSSAPGEPFMSWDEFVEERTGMTPAQVAGVGPYGERWVPDTPERVIDFGDYQETTPSAEDDREIDFGEYQETVGPEPEPAPKETPKPVGGAQVPPGQGLAPPPAAPAPKLGTQYGTHIVDGREVTVSPLTAPPPRQQGQPRQSAPPPQAVQQQVQGRAQAPTRTAPRVTAPAQQAPTRRQPVQTQQPRQTAQQPRQSVAGMTLSELMQGIGLPSPPTPTQQQWGTRDPFQGMGTLFGTRNTQQRQPFTRNPYGGRGW